MLYGAFRLTPAAIDALTPRDVLEMVAGWSWSLEAPGSNAWLLANLLNSMGSQIPLTARMLLGRGV